MTRSEIIESAHACMNHAGHCDKCEWDNRACWGGMTKTEAAEWMIGEHRLTPEEQRYIELGKAVKAAFEELGILHIGNWDDVDHCIKKPDELLEWHRAEAHND